MGIRISARRLGATTAVLALAAGALAVVTAVSPAEAAVATPEHPSASAAATSLTINTIPTRKAGTYGDVLVTPSVTAKGNVVVSKKVLTVKKGARTVVRDKASALLRAGTYKLTQKVTYRTFTSKTVYPTVFQQGQTFGGDYDSAYVDRCVVASVAENQIDFVAACDLTWFEMRTNPETFDDEIAEIWTWTGITITGTYNAEESSYTLDGDITYTDFDGFNAGDVLDTVTQILLPEDLRIPKLQRTYAPVVTRSKTQTLVVKKGPRARSCASYADYKRVSVDFAEPWEYGDSKAGVKRILRSDGRRVSFTDTGSAAYEVRSYKACTGGASIRVGFEDGYAFAKRYSK